MQNNNISPVIEIKNISFAYDKDLVLENINLSIYDKDFLVLIGPNGGGKSTLIKLILGIEKNQEGSIEILNKSSEDGISYVPQNTNVNINFPIKVMEVVMMGDKSRRSSIFGYKKEEVNHAIEILKQVGLHDVASQKIASLSGGQRQRVMIARALYSNPKILLLDEPTSSIDAEGQKQIYELLKELNEKVTIIVISHDLSVTLKYATKVAHINKKLSYHDISSLKKEFDTDNNHFCEVELLQMLGRSKC